jgi:acetyl-CoA acetyltransferase
VTDVVIRSAARTAVGASRKSLRDVPKTMGIGPVPAVRRARQRAGKTLEDVDVIELHEAFAAQSLAVMSDLDLDPAKVNPNDGTIALGHQRRGRGLSRAAPKGGRRRQPSPSAWPSSDPRSG